MRLAEIIQLSHYVEAKAKHLKALDFTIGLLKRLKKQGKKFPIDYGVAIGRLKHLRKVSQSQFRLDTLMQNITHLRGIKGKVLLNKMQDNESKLIPHQKDMASFRQDFPNNSKKSQNTQEKLFLKTVIKTYQPNDASKIEDLVIKDALIFQKCYDAVLPMLHNLKCDVDRMMPKNLGTYVSRIKSPESAFPKQVRDEREPFFRFRDLVGCRILTDDVASLAAAANSVQKEFDIVQKKNYYLKNQGYNAINYVLSHNGLLFEFQLKTTINDIEANISHDLIYAKEKAIVQLSQQEKSLVSKVIDVSTQLSMRDWESLMQQSDIVTASTRQ